MSNEFIARKGLISLSDTQLTGSLLVSASQGSGKDLYVSGSAKSPRVGIGTTSPIKELHVSGSIMLEGSPDGNRYILLNEDATGETRFTMQAGAGSAGYGGGINLYGHAHDSLPGWVKAGISNGSGGKFAVNTQGTGGGTDVLTVDASGNTYVAGNIELGHASDTTITRASSGDITIEGNAVYRAGGTDVPVADGGTGASSLTDGGILLGSGTGAVTAMAVLADGEMVVGDGTTDPVAESGATLRTSIGVGTGDNVQFAQITGSALNLTAAGVRLVDGEALGWGDNSYRIEGKDDGGNARVGFVIADAEAMRINTSGVGIGTTAPAAKLHVSASSAAQSLLHVEGNSGVDGLFVTSSGFVGIGTTSPGVKLQVGSGDATPYGGNSDTRLGYFTAAGRADVYVRDSSNDIETVVRAGTDKGYVGTSTNHDLQFITNGANVMALTAGGVLNINGATNTYSTGELIVKDSGNGGIFVTDNTKYLAMWATHGGGSHAGSVIGTRSNHDFCLVTNDTKRLTATAAGLVGIGTTSPSHTLSVVGHVSASQYTGSFSGDGSQLTGLSSAAISSYTNNTNNRVITSVDSSTVNAEANLVFDGTNLGIGQTSPAGLMGDTNDPNVMVHLAGTRPGFVLEDTDDNLDFEIVANAGFNIWDATNDVNSFYIKAAGDIGIGTTSPDGKLHVHKGTAGSVTAPSNSNLIVESNTNNYISMLVPDGSNQGIYFGEHDDNDRASIIVDGGSNDMAFTVGAAHVMTLDGAAQRVGIGTTAPAAKLHVSASSAAQSLLHVEGNLGIDALFVSSSGYVGHGTTAPAHHFDLANYVDPTLRIKSDSGGDPRIIFDAAAANRSGLIKFYDNGSTTGGFIDYAHNGDMMKFGAGSSTSTTFLVGDGEVGIGTTDPNAMLDIVGTTGTILQLNNEATAHEQGPHLELIAGPGGSIYGDAWMRFVDYGESKTWAMGTRDQDNQFCINYTASTRTGQMSSTPEFAITEAGNVGIGTDAAALTFGADSEITLTHSHNDGLILNTDKKLFFYDATQFIHASDAATLVASGGGSTMTLNSTGLTTNNQLIVSGTGPHGIGYAASDYISLVVGGAFSSGGATTRAGGLVCRTVLTGAVGDTVVLATMGAGETWGSQIITQGTDTNISICATMHLSEPDIVNNLASSGKPDYASTLYVKNAPTEGDENYAILSHTGNVKFAVGDVMIDATQKLYLDGGGNTYITEAGGDYIQVFCNGSSRFQIQSDGIIVPSGNKIYLDGGGNSYFDHPSSDNIRCVIGTNEIWRATSGTTFGIGTAAPQNMLHVHRTGSSGHWATKIENSYNSANDVSLELCYANSSGRNSGMNLTMDDANSGEYLALMTSGGTQRMKLTADGRIFSIGANNTKEVNFANGANGLENVLHFECDGTTKWALYSYDRSNAHYTDWSIAGALMYLDKANDRVGIGETSPDTPLHVKGAAVRAADSSATLTLEGSAGSAGTAGINILSNDTANILFGDAGNSGIGKITYVHDGNSMRFTTNDATRFTIASDGKAVFNYGTTAIWPSAGLGSYWAVANEWAFSIHHNGAATTSTGMAIVCGTDDASGTNTAIYITDGDGSNQGDITFTSGTVSYNAFTAGHDVSLPDSEKTGYDYGTLVEIVEIHYKKRKDGSETERGILYKVKKSQSAYAKNVLGAYSGQKDAEVNDDDNLHQIYCLGDGHILCNGEKGNIAIGDGICTSSTVGVGMKADKLSMIIGIAQEATTFSSASETKLVPVQYGLQQFQPWE